MADDRVVIFIDGSNFYHGLKGHCSGKTKINFEKFANKLVNGRKLVRTYYYNAPVDQLENPEKYKAQQKFFSALDRVPYLERSLGKLVRRTRSFTCSSCKKVDSTDFRMEKGVDVSIAVDMLVTAHRDLYDIAILVSGDGDFEKAMRGVKDTGRHVENAYFKGGHSNLLMKECDKFTELSKDFLKGCW
ncbi:MAG: NYN domain-containing protein [Thermodesulfobacteriota bacterium]